MSNNLITSNIAGIGIDSVEIERFSQWADYPVEKLQKTHSEKEIAYCLANKEKSAERFAARFAAKEAFFKALSQIVPNHTIPFLTICKNTQVTQETNGNPQLLIHWETLLQNQPTKPKNPYRSHISITHTKTIATAIVIVENC